MIVISSIEQNELFPLEFAEQKGTNFGTLYRRVKRSATLDGGVVLSDYGFSHADRTFQLYLKYDADKYSKVLLGIQLYSEFTVSCRDGFFRCSINEAKVEKQNIVINALILEKLS